MDVSIIIVNYHTSELVKECINSINEKSFGFSYEIVIVDNSESSSEYDNLKAEYGNVPKVQLIKSEINLGFGKANNLGSKFAHGKYLYFLNSDTLLLNNSIYELYSFLEMNTDASICGSNLYTLEKLPGHSFIKNEFDLNTFKRIHSIFRSFLKKIFRAGRFDFNYKNNPIKINGYVCGASLMISKADFDNVDGFDKDIFMYAEETLLCYNIIHFLKKNIYNIPSSKIIHLESASDNVCSESHALNQISGTYIYFNKAYGKRIADKYLNLSKKIYKKEMIFYKMRNNNIRFCNSKVYYETISKVLSKELKLK